MLIIIDVALWVSTRDTLLALHLSVVADAIAFTPTLVKTWRLPNSETPFFFIAGIIAPLLNIVATGKYNYGVLLFPTYIALANIIETVLILARRNTKGYPKVEPLEPVI